MTSQLIYNEAVALGMPKAMASLITAQARHESGDFSSHVFKTDNNLNGYKYVGQKLATKGNKSPEGDYYAHYATVTDSVREIVGWIRRRQAEGKFPQDLSAVTTPAQYAQLLKGAGYYGDTVQNYTAGLSKYFKNYSIGAAGLLIAAALVYLVVKHRFQ